MSSIPTIKKGDLLPIYRAILRDPNGTIAPLAGASSVLFSMRHMDTGEVKVYRKAASIVSAVTGEVSYSWAAGDTDTPGVYEIEWVAIYLGSKPMTYPGDGFNQIEIAEGI